MTKDIYLAIYILIHPNLGTVHTAFSLSSKTHRARPHYRFDGVSTDCTKTFENDRIVRDVS